MRPLIRPWLVWSLVLTACGEMEEPRGFPPSMGPDEAPPPTPVAKAALSGAQPGVAGEIKLTATDEAVLVTGDLRGLDPGPHGLHVHEGGTCEAPGFGSAGGHFTGGTRHHGSPTDARHHAGDFGNLTANADGRAEVAFTSRRISLDADDPRSVVGRTWIVHERADDLISQPSGDAGPRTACGVITLVE